MIIKKLKNMASVEIEIMSDNSDVELVCGKCNLGLYVTKGHFNTILIVESEHKGYCSGDLEVIPR